MKTFRILFGILLIIFLTQLTYAVTFSGSQTQFTNPNVQNYYSSIGVDYSSFWNNLDNPDKCEARQDFIVNIRPGSCMPSVVRSDLLEEQNVPVFCMLDVIKINPLISVSQIKNVRIKGSYPKEISGVSYHPGNAALKIQNPQLDNPLINDIGYVVVSLKKSTEREMKDSVIANLSVEVTYDMEKAFGVGKGSYYLPLMTDQQWSENYINYGFWKGKGYLRAENIDENTARISIYTDKDIIYKSVNIQKGTTSNLIYLPGFYCMAALKLQLQDISAPKTRALIDIDGASTWVVKGESILDNKCRVEEIIKTGTAGEIRLRCGGNYLTLNVDTPNEVIINNQKIKVGELISGSDYLLYYGKINSEEFIVTADIASGNSKDNVLNRVVVDTKLNNIKSQISTLSQNAKSVDAIEKRVKIYVDSQLHIGENSIKIFKKGDGQFTGATINEQIYEGNGQQVETNFKESQDTTNTIVDYYKTQEEGTSTENKKIYYGAEALLNLAWLSRDIGKQITQIKILDKLIQEYPDTEQGKTAQIQKQAIGKYDYSQASSYVYIDSQAHIINLLDVQQPEKEKASAKFEISIQNKDADNKPTTIEKEFVDLGIGDISDINDDKKFELKELYIDRAIITYYQKSIKDGTWTTGSDRTITKTAPFKDGDIILSLASTEVEYVAKINILPEIPNAVSEANITFAIGIEKRAIQLSPNKTREMIKNINESIKKWEDINNNLGNVVKGWTKACLATSATLTIKNFFNNLQGKGIARKSLMDNFWNSECKTQATDAGGTYSEKAFNACLMLHNNDINNGVEEMTTQMNTINSKIETLTASCYTRGGFLGVDVIKKDCMKDAAEQLLNDNWDTIKKVKITTVGSQYNDKTLADLGTDETKSKDKAKDMIKDGTLTFNEIRDLSLYGNLYSSETAGLKDMSQNILDTKLNTVFEYSQAKTDTKSLSNTLKTLTGKTVPIDTGITKEGTNKLVETFKVDKDLTIDQTTVPKGDYVVHYYKGKTYFIPISVVSNGVLNIKDGSFVFTEDPSGNLIQDKAGSDLTADSMLGIIGGEGISNFVQASKQACENTYTNPEVRYYDSGKLKGKPEVVPLDTKRGWYAATKPITLSYQGTQPYTEAGAAVSLYICNVGQNGMEQWESSPNDDEPCTEINYQTAQPLNDLPCLTTDEATKLTKAAKRIVEQAASQYGKKKISLNLMSGTQILNGVVAKITGDAKCTDLMSPSDCSWLYNVCDPVLCPSSRCNLGGEYQVDDVVQSGIIGSLVLCLPNFGNPAEGGVAVPICLTGVHAGLEGYITNLQAHRDCLQENLDSGKYTGICDEMYSIYACDFFWRQFVPIMKALVPKAIEWISTGGKMQGGGEYLTFQESWNTMENSANYFVNSYGLSVFEAFKKRSTSDIGAEVCKSYVSTRYPNSADLIDQLSEPASPTQFTATLTETPFTDATVVPTSQYKVYYHIYAGKDTGVNYQVYLKGSTGTMQYYNIQDSILVPGASGYISKGTFVDQAKDFTAPSGYTELCVRINNKDNCGFGGKVSTDFAVEYIKEKYVSTELQKDINSEKECVSGSTNLYSLININVQESVQGLITPDLNSLGITRICSTGDPAGDLVYNTKSADKYENGTSRQWAKIGYCDKDKQIYCWANQDQIKEILKIAGIEAATISTIQDQQKTIIDSLVNQGGLLDKTAANNAIDKLKTLQKELLTQISLGTQTEDKITEFNKAVDNIITNSLEDNPKAQALYMKYQVYAAITKKQAADYNLAQGNKAKNAAKSVADTKATIESNRVAIETELKKIDSRLSIDSDGNVYFTEIISGATSKTKIGQVDLTTKKWITGASDVKKILTDKKMSDADAAKVVAAIAAAKTSTDEVKDNSASGGTAETLSKGQIAAGEKILSVMKTSGVEYTQYDDIIKTETGASSFKCFILQMALQESSLYHCNPFITGTTRYNSEYGSGNYFYCDNQKGDLTNLRKASGDEESYGILQLNKKNYDTKIISYFDNNVKQAVSTLTKNYESCKTWKAALGKYNTGSCNENAAHVSLVLSEQATIAQAFPNECGGASTDEEVKTPVTTPTKSYSNLVFEYYGEASGATPFSYAFNGQNWYYKTGKYSEWTSCSALTLWRKIITDSENKALIVSLQGKTFDAGVAQILAAVNKDPKLVVVYNQLIPKKTYKPSDIKSKGSIATITEIKTFA